MRSCFSHSDPPPLLLLFISCLVISCPLRAQRASGPATGELTLEVTDKAGLKLPGAAINMKSEVAANRSMVTDREGRATFKSLPLGRYVATVRLTGFETVERTNIDIKLNASTTIRVTLDVNENLGIHYSRPKPTKDSRRITEITIRRTECFGECPVYTTTLRSDGTAMSVGDEHSILPGTWQGE